jgi:serine/threonine protein kinase
MCGDVVCYWPSVCALPQALACAHGLGIIHRDLKWDNVAVNLTSGQATLIDWGLSEFYIPGRNTCFHGHVFSLCCEAIARESLVQVGRTTIEFAHKVTSLLSC